jgi:hypothetical protein
MIYHAIRVSIRIDPLGLAQASLKGYLSNYTVSGRNSLTEAPTETETEHDHGG